MIGVLAIFGTDSHSHSHSYSERFSPLRVHLGAIRRWRMQIAEKEWDSITAVSAIYPG
jgi:hypothetical protein